MTTAVRKRKKRSYWYEFFEEECVLCMAFEVEKVRVYDRPKPKDYRDRHHVKERACVVHFL